MIAFRKFEIKTFQITWSSIANNTESINTRQKNESNIIQCFITQSVSHGFHIDCNFKDININQLVFLFFLCCREKVDDNKEFSRGNSKLPRESRITT